MELTDYQIQLAKMKRWNRLMIGATVAFMLLVFFGLLGYAIYQSGKSQEQTEQIITYVTKQRQVTSAETRLSREGGDIIRCMLLITNTTPPEQRTMAQINSCYPGGSPEAWAKQREEVLREQ